MPIPLSVLLVYSYFSILAVKLNPYPGPGKQITKHLATAKCEKLLSTHY